MSISFTPGMLIGISLVIAVFFVLFLFYKQKQRKRYDVSKITIKDIDKMDGYEFEDYLYVLFQAFGYQQTYQTKKSRDYGADLLFIDGEGKKTVVQAKRYADKIGLSAVQEVYAAHAFYRADKAMIITSASNLSEPCLKLASASNVKIIDREDLEEIIQLFKKGHVQKVQQYIEAPDLPIEFSADKILEQPEGRRGYVQAGDYFYKKIK